MTPSPIRALAAHDLATAATARIQACFDAEMDQFLRDCQAHGFNGRDRLAGLMTTAAHVSAHAQAKAELAAISCATSAAASFETSRSVREHLRETIAKLVPATIQVTAEDLAREAASG